MIPPCEIMVREYFPSIRGIIAKELIFSLGYSQKEAAEVMGLTQPAVSQYLKRIRGDKRAKEIMNNKRIMEKIKEISRELHRLKDEEKKYVMCRLCKILREEFYI